MLRQLSAKFSNNILTFFFATGVICGLSGQGHAAGFYIQEQSVSGLGSAYAGQSAMPRDASILFYNPAGITYLEQAQASLGVHFIAPHMKLKDTGTTLDPVGAVLVCLHRSVWGRAITISFSGAMSRQKQTCKRSISIRHWLTNRMTGLPLVRAR